MFGPPGLESKSGPEYLVQSYKVLTYQGIEVEVGAKIFAHGLQGNGLAKVCILQGFVGKGKSFLV